MARYRTRHLERVAAQFTGGNAGELRALIPPGAGTIEAAYREPVLILHAPGRDPRLIHLGDWLSTDGQAVTVHSDESFRRTWELAGLHVPLLALTRRHDEHAPA